MTEFPLNGSTPSFALCIQSQRLTFNNLLEINRLEVKFACGKIIILGSRMTFNTFLEGFYEGYVTILKKYVK